MALAHTLLNTSAYSVLRSNLAGSLVQGGGQNYPGPGQILCVETGSGKTQRDLEVVAPGFPSQIPFCTRARAERASANPEPPRGRARLAPRG